MAQLTNPKDPEGLAAAAIIRKLQSDSALFDLVHVAEPAEIRDVTLPALCFRFYPGGGTLDVGHRELGMQVWSFSEKNYSEASAVYRQFRNALHKERLARDGIFGYAKEVRTPSWNYDADLEEYIVTTLWQVRLTEPVND